MGRSRAVSRTNGGEDPNQSRLKRKRIGPNVDYTETATATASTVCQETIEGKGALYHCNYCHKDVTGTIRIKCVVCPDFDLCIECFGVGAEVNPHKSNHPYRVMDNLAFPLICPDWNVDEEMLLLEGIEMYGFGNWTEVAEHVGTKSKSQCIDHYDTVYMNSPCFPLPDMSHVMGKSREELLEMAKAQCTVKKEAPVRRELSLKQESPISTTIKREPPRKEDLARQSSSISNAEIGSQMGLSSANTVLGVKNSSTGAQVIDNIRVEEPQADRSIGEKKPRVSGEEGRSVTELSGYNFKRREFEIEYDNDAEQLLADMEFKDTDTDAEYELKLRVLRIYSKRLEERKRRKDFILERNLLYPDPFEKILLDEEKAIYQRFKVFMRFHSKEQHEELMKSVILEHRIMKRIQDLQEARAAGCRTAAQANEFIQEKRGKEAEEGTGPSNKVSQRPYHLKGEADSSPRGLASGTAGLHPTSEESSSSVGKQCIQNPLEDWDISGFPGADMLSESEKHLCGEIRLLPAHYLNILQVLSTGIMKGTITKKSDAHSLFKVEPGKLDKVYDMLIKKGIAQA